MRIELDHDRPVVVTDDARIVAERLIVSAGAGSSGSCPLFPVDLRPTRQQVLYFRACRPFGILHRPVPGVHLQGIARGRSVLRHAGLPGPGCEGRARTAGPNVDPDIEDRTIEDDYKPIVRDSCEITFPPWPTHRSISTEVCLYTVAPDEQFQVDFLPGRADVIVASPCSGHGFKFSCLIGRVLADLALSGKTDLPVDIWKIAERHYGY